MTGKSHVATNAVVSYALFEAHPMICIGAIIAAKLPDQMENFLPGVKHRGPTHIMIVWAFLSVFLGAAFFYPTIFIFSWGIGETTKGVMFGIALGGLLHILADFFSVTGVPFIRTGHYVAMKWYKTGKFSEYLMLAGVVLVGAGVICAHDPKRYHSIQTTVNSYLH